MDDIIDLKEVMERVQDDRELLMELIQIFLDDCPPKITALRKAADEKNFVQIADLAHAMKGSSGNLAAKKISGIFLQIEQLGRQQKTENINGLLDQVERYLGDVRVYLGKLKNEKPG